LSQARLLVATHNPGKAREIRDLLKGLPVDIITLEEVDPELKVSEDGETFSQNAALKALTLARKTGCVTIADDSGLEVDALGGRPGVRSARYAGPNASDGDRVEKLLREMRGVPAERRTARFRCAAAVASPDGRLAVHEAATEGTIARRPRGTGGFGYDPIFVGSDGRTFAELGPEEKNAVSHRGRALRLIRLDLVRILGLEEEAGRRRSG